MKVIRLSALRTRILYRPGSIPGTHICHRLSQPQVNNMAETSKPMENRIDLIGNGTREIADYSVVPQSAAPPRTPSINICNINTWSMQYYMAIKQNVLGIEIAV